MRAVTIFLGLLMVISLVMWKSNAQNDPNPIGATEQSTINSISSNPVTEIPSDGDFELPEISPTAEPTNLPLATYTFPPTDMVFPQETASPELETTISPSDVVPSITATSTAELIETQEVTIDATNLVSVTTTGTEMAEITPTSQPTPVSLACELDEDADGVVTDRDLSEIGQKLLNSAVNETTSIYDLNENHQIDIGDLQKIVTYLFTTCPT
jgi:hypothetical protein